MRYCESLIEQIYLGLEEFDNFDFLTIEPSEERYIFRRIDQLNYEDSVESDITYELGELCEYAFTAGGVKGFLSGIYFALKLSDEYKEDLEKIEEFINSFED